MNKFNLPLRNLLKDRRSKRAHLRRLRSGNPSLKVHASNTPALKVSGKKKRKLLKKWHRAQKDALASGLVSMQDIEMIAADNSVMEQGAQMVSEKTTLQGFHMKKRAKLRLKKFKNRNKQAVSNIPPASSEDVMMQ